MPVCPKQKKEPHKSLQTSTEYMQFVNISREIMDNVLQCPIGSNAEKSSLRMLAVKLSS